MATTITGPVRLPDGSIPTHGRVIFSRRTPLAADRIVTTAPIEVLIPEGGAISVALEGEDVGTRYGVEVEQWSKADGRPVATRLPDIIVTGAGSGPIGNYATVEVATRDTYDLHQGDTASLPVTLLDAHHRPANIGDASVGGWLESGETIVAVIVAKTDAAKGLVEFKIAAEVSAALAKGLYTAVIRLVVGADVRTVRGKIKII